MEKEEIQLSPDAEKENEKTSKYSCRELIIFATITFGSFCDEACFSLQAPFFPREAELKGQRPSQYGFIFGLFQLTVFIFAPVVEKLIAYVDPKIILNCGIFIVGAACFCFGFLECLTNESNFVCYACSLRILEGIGAAAFQVSSYTIIGSRFSKNLGISFAVISTLEGVGAIIGPLIGGILYDIGGFSLPFNFIGILAVLDAVAVFFIVPRQDRKVSTKSNNWKKFLLNPVTILTACVVFTTFNYLGYNEATLEPHIRQLGLSGLYLGMVFAVDGVVYALMASFCGWICDKKSCNQIVVIFGCFAMIFSMALIGPMPFLGLNCNLGTILGSLVLFGIGDACKLVAVMSYCVKKTVARGLPDDLSTYSLASSMFVSAESLGCFIGPSLGGYIVETAGYNFGTYLLGILEIILVFVLLVYIYITKVASRKSAPEEHAIARENTRSYG